MKASEQSQEDTMNATEKKFSNAKCCGIYGLRNKINNKWYVGQSAVNIENRWNEYKRLQCYNQPKLLNALTKYGYDAFDKIVLEECSNDQKLIDEREDYWIRHYDSVENGYNCRYGGANGKMGYEARLRVKQGCLNKQPSEKWLAAMAENGRRQKGKIVSEETRMKMRIAQKERYKRGDTKLNKKTLPD